MIIQDGSQAFGIEASPVTINGVTYVAEGMSFNFTSTRADLNNSNGEPLATTIVKGRIEGSATLQLSSASASPDLVGQTFVLQGTRASGAYMITDSSETQSQGDYVKVAVSFYRKLNPTITSATFATLVDELDLSGSANGNSFTITYDSDVVTINVVTTLSTSALSADQAEVLKSAGSGDAGTAISLLALLNGTNSASEAKLGTGVLAKLAKIDGVAGGTANQVSLKSVASGVHTISTANVVGSIAVGGSSTGASQGLA
jgi:hypothetical protein